jgi:hypothetical protein
MEPGFESALSESKGPSCLRLSLTLELGLAGEGAGGDGASQNHHPASVYPCQGPTAKDI